jgi:DNA repair protein SbcD/Mre11
MRFLVFADLHLDAPFRWASPDLARSRRRALRTTLTRIRDLVESERVDAVLCGGDLYEHDRFSPDTVQFLGDVFAGLHPCPVFLSPGNHDWYGEQSLYRQAPWTPNVRIFTEDRLTPLELADGVTLWGAAHRAPANTDGFLEHGFKVDRSGVNVALFHGSEEGEFRWQEEGKVPHAPFRESQIPESGLEHAFCGHFHTPRDARWHTYPGNPDPLTFGETGERGVVLAEVSADGQVTRARRSVAVSQVRDADVDLTGVTHADEVRERVGAAVAGLSGIVRVTLQGEVDPDLDVRLGDLSTGWDHLEALVPRVGAVTVGYDLSELRAEQSVRGQFVRDVEADTPLDNDVRRKVLITGLRALAGRKDELEVL